MKKCKPNISGRNKVIDSKGVASNQAASLNTLEKQEKSIHRALALSVANQLTNIFRDREKCQYNGFRKLCSMISFEQLSPL
uniref:Uncharacterized protein n=1 Tax=Oryza nivara TaxID=4536 RepID=A0A0E0I1V0_ORYNI